MIKPSIGRVLWFYPGYTVDQPYAALVTFVHGDREVNLAFFYPNGASAGAKSVVLVQEGDAPPDHGRYATWMSYRVGQAKKHEEPKQLELKV